MKISNLIKYLKPSPASQSPMRAAESGLLPARSTPAEACECALSYPGAMLLVTLLAWVGLTTPNLAAATELGGKRDLTVLTRNLYVGANLTPIVQLDPSDPNYLQQLVGTVTAVYYTTVVQNDFHVRVAGIVDEIVATAPDLVGLQEVTTLRVQSPGDLVYGGSTPASVVVVDYLQVLLDALAERGAHYAAVSMSTDADIELPMLNLVGGGIDDVRLTDHDVILARTDLPPGYLRLKNPANGNFQVNLTFPSTGLQLKRGWCSVDASVRGRTFRFINTHLEEESFPEIQWLQAQEILSGPANVDLPLIFVGDCNSDGNHQNGTVAYDGLLNAGLADSWSVLHPNDPGLTWGHDSFLANPALPFVWRIDLILYRGATFAPMEASLLDAPLPRLAPPFWASDHAGVVTRFLLK